MTTRRTLFAAASALVASLASANSALAQGAQQPPKQAERDHAALRTAVRAGLVHVQLEH
jgi:hypothetical protein